MSGGGWRADYRYSIGLVYNTFPTPPGFGNEELRTCRNWSRWRKPCSPPAAPIRDATLADLYDPDLMPPNLRRAHQTLDRAVDRLYRRERLRFGAGARRTSVHAL